MAQVASLFPPDWCMFSTQRGGQENMTHIELARMQWMGAEKDKKKKRESGFMQATAMALSLGDVRHILNFFITFF